MDPALKQRLVGATVLVALGVIFIPMLLERGSDDARLSVQMEIPPQPEIKFKDPQPLDNKPISKPQPLKEAVQAAQAQKQAEQAKPKAPTKKPPAKEKPVTAAKVKPKATAAKPKATSGKQWIVQVGSFSRKVNAQVLSDKLKALGFSAFVESAKANTGPVYRVRIGPLANREAATKMVKQLDRKGGYKGIILSYAD